MTTTNTGLHHRLQRTNKSSNGRRLYDSDTDSDDEANRVDDTVEVAIEGALDDYIRCVQCCYGFCNLVLKFTTMTSNMLYCLKVPTEIPSVESRCVSVVCCDPNFHLCEVQ